MSARITWAADSSTPVSLFTLEKSTNGGLSFSALTTIAADYGGANYDKRTRLFFYVDGAGSPGHVYRLMATGDDGDSAWVFIVVPPNPPGVCTIVGYLIDAAGQAPVGAEVRVSAAGSKEGRWAKNPTGTHAKDSEALGVALNTNVVYVGADGMWQVDLLQGCIARVTIPIMRFDIVFQAPNQAGLVNIRDVKELRGQDMWGLFPEMNGMPSSPR